MLSFYVFHRHSICLVDYMDLICTLCRWWGGFMCSSLATQPLVFNCGFISVSACGSSKGVYFCGCSEGLGFPSVRTKCEGGTAAWVEGALEAPGTQRSLWLGQQEIWCSRRAWQPSLLFPPGESHRQRSQQATVHRVAKHWTWLKPSHLQAQRSFSSLWKLCSSGDHGWRWHGCLGHGDPGNASYAGALAAIVTGDMALLGLFSVLGISVPVKIKHDGGTVLGPLMVLTVWGHRLLQSGSKLENEYAKTVYCHPAYLTYMQSTSCEILSWMKNKLESRLPGELSITSDLQMTSPLWQRVKRNLKASWCKWKRRVKKLA